MAVQPFTPDGVQNKQAELYELSDIDLQTQRDLIKDELRTWVTDNFSLTEDQVSYLNNMDEAYISYTAYEVSPCSRKPLSGVPYSDRRPGQRKAGTYYR